MSALHTANAVSAILRELGDGFDAEAVVNRIHDLEAVLCHLAGAVPTAARMAELEGKPLTQLAVLDIFQQAVRAAKTDRARRLESELRASLETMQ